jgi:hypothetical protein
VTQAVGAVGTCGATDYALVSPDMDVNQTVPTGADQGTWGGATIQFNNKPTINQDGCKGATVTIAYVSN